MLREDYPTLQLRVDEDFDGSRGYGFLDYVILLGFLAILVTEAKTEDIQKGVTQNLVQLHTAAEKLGKRKREEKPNINVYGIVTTGLSWRFVRWSGFEENLSIEISEVISCEYGNDMKQAKEVLSIISGILQSQANFYNERRVRARSDGREDDLQLRTSTRA
ncbi:hypothetical protein BC936DRAFT_138293 [Jimgerdemannia flammicorona]|uniref:Uncharacterized protein n=1 Tax=Jimgerdemannia flammicorona TaxID=994334 RepID=A0A433CTK3_9FUNG|nr:hypothetical protein BC936DRAFT_138293 [Jimgerdemannia flammicorona]